MSENKSKAYSPKEVEKKWYEFWEKHALFQANPNSEKPPFCIVMPPPNVTGVLHMGHALVDTLQDILIRYKRMSGFEALWVPGTDHAGISTQTVVEKHLIKTTGKRRKEFPREEFIGHILDWKERHENKIINQIKKLGCSCDWSRLKFTMDKPLNKAVNTVFKKMYEDGLIYQGDYLVNWDPATQTALADDEVEYEEKDSFLWYLKYPIENSDEFLYIATTRPETMLGDTGIAVAPNDERYNHLIGKNEILPLQNRPIPIFADHHVDKEFGTGVVKVTPAHDPNDYEMGMRHNLEMINILTPDGKINENGGKFQGLTTSEARESVVAALKEIDLIDKIEPHTHRVGVSYRSKAVIEPYLSKQWFVKMSHFKEQLIDIVKDDRVKLVPDHWKSTYFHWIENLRDWCISRQLWWGHRIPIYYHKDDKTKIKCHIEDTPLSNEWIQDEDVLDTWFSSSLWPFSTLGYPDKTPEMDKFYPNATLITGHDILFFWVARMILMGTYVMGEVPFKESFLHGLIYGKSYWREKPGLSISYVTADEKTGFDLGEPIPKDVHSKWEKMSKSKGNGIDPLEIIDIYGADAMRMALTASTTHARQLDLDRRRFEEFKNFANKVWNGARFVLMNITTKAIDKPIDLKNLYIEDKWILSSLNSVVKEVSNHLDNYEFDHAATKAYTFFWDEFCAYYVEISKPTLFGKTDRSSEDKQKILLVVLTSIIRLLHPMTPFITEEIFASIKDMFPDLSPDSASLKELDPYTKDLLEALSAKACIVAPFPKMQEDPDETIQKMFQDAKEIIYSIRNIRAEMGLPPSAKTAIHFICEKPFSKDLELIICSLVKTDGIFYEEPTSTFTSMAIYKDTKIKIPLPEEFMQKEKDRIQKELIKLTQKKEGIEKKLSNKNIVDKAPKELVKKSEDMLNDLTTQLHEIVQKLSDT